MSQRLRWGILGTGNIARQFAAGVATAARSDLAAVGSRDLAAAKAFAAANGIPAAHGSYADLVADPGVDAVYNALPNHLHHRWTIAATAAGKHVLCEKPFAVDAAEAAEMVAAADRHGRVVVEAFMHRCHPLLLAVKKAVDDGAIGELKLVRTSFCYRTSKVAGNVRFEPSMAGGALMDVGCYCVNFARWMAGGEPVAVHAVAQKHPTGVDEGVVGTLAFADGVVATFACSMGTQSDNTATVCGTEGYIEVPVPWKPQAATSRYVVCRGTPPKMDGGPRLAPSPPRTVVDVPTGGELYGIEADAFAAVVLDGATPWITAADTMGNMAVLDEIRRQVGIAFPSSAMAHPAEDGSPS